MTQFTIELKKDAPIQITKRQMPYMDRLQSSQDQLEGARAFTGRLDLVKWGK